MEASWKYATREGVERFRVREALRMTVRERLELMDRLSRTGRALAAMPRCPARDSGTEG